MQLKRYVARLSPVRRRAEIDAKARALIAESGDGAYYIARDLARVTRPLGEPPDPTWSKVARRIAAITGHEIGVTGSDRRPTP